MRDLLAEHAALKKEQAELQKAILDEWRTMSASIARQRETRFWEITQQLEAIERTKTWRNRP